MHIMELSVSYVGNIQTFVLSFSIYSMIKKGYCDDNKNNISEFLVC